MQRIFSWFVVIVALTSGLLFWLNQQTKPEMVEYRCSDGSVSIGTLCPKRIKTSQVTLTNGQTVTLKSEQVSDGSWVFPAEEVAKLKPYFPEVEKTYFHGSPDEAGAVAKSD